MKVLRRRGAPPAPPAEADSDPERDLAYAIAQAVYDLRTDKGLSQQELADLIGTKQPRVSVVESAVKLPSLPLLLRIASAFGLRLTVRFEKREETDG